MAAIPATHPEAGSLDMTVAICTRDRVHSLVVTLDSLARQEWTGAWEVLVIDNASTDDTDVVAAARAATFPVPLRVVTEPTPGVSYARNRGLTDALGRVVVYADDDVTCHPGWVAAHGEALADGTYSGAGGRIIPQLPPGAPAWLRELAATDVGGPMARFDFGPAGFELVPGAEQPAPFTANASVLAHAGREIGGFRTDLGDRRKLVLSEDVDFYARLVEAGHRLWYLPEAVVDHRIDADRTTDEFYFRWQRGHGRAIALLYGPRGKLDHARHLARYARRLVWAQIAVQRSRRLPDEARLAVRRDRERVVGSLLQLLGR